MAEDLDLGFFERIRFGLGRNTVRILLDLDGAVAAEGKLPEGSFLPFSGSGYATWQVRKRVLEWIAERRRDERVELIWSSTWQDYANSILREVGIEPIDWIRFDENYQMPGDWYKKDGIVEFLEDAPDPIVLIDDELPPAFLRLQNPRILAIKTDSLIGLTDEDLERIDKFVEDYRERKIR